MSNEYKVVKVDDSIIKDVTVVQPVIHYDNRGENVETFCADYYRKMFKM